MKKQCAWACLFVGALAFGAQADPYSGTSYGKATCAEYNQVQPDAKAMVFAWFEGYLLGAWHIGNQLHQERFAALNGLQLKKLTTLFDATCKYAPDLTLERLAWNMLNEILKDPNFYKSP